jgi:hypothetical protein
MKTKIETREVLAGAYRTGHAASMLTHAVVMHFIGGIWSDVEVLCRRVSFDSLADCYSGVDRTSEPTCPSCRAAVKRLTKGRARIR